MLVCTFQYVHYVYLYLLVFVRVQYLASVRRTWEVEAAVPMAFGRGVGWWSGAGRVALLEGCWGGGCG